MDIVVPDTNWHTLTVFAPDRFADSRHSSYTLTPQGAASPSVVYEIEEPEGANNHIIQYRFKGNVTLTVKQLPSYWNHDANLSALFID